MNSSSSNSSFEFSDDGKSLRKNFNKSIENIQCLTFTVSNDLTIFDVNETAVSVLGYTSKSQLTGRSLLDTIYDQSIHDEINTLFERLEFESDLRDEIVTIISRDGKTMQVMLNVDTVLDNSGNPLCRVLTHVAFTRKWKEKKQGRKVHQHGTHREETYPRYSKSTEQNSILEGIIEQSLFAISISDASGTLVRANKKFRAFMNMSNEDLIGKYNIFHNASLLENDAIPRIKSVFESLRPARFNILCRNPIVRNKYYKGNRYVWIHVFAYPVLGNDGHLKNVVFQWVDINDSDPAYEVFDKSEEFTRNIYRRGHSIVF